MSDHRRAAVQFARWQRERKAEIERRRRTVRMQATTDYRTWRPDTGYINNHLFRLPVTVAAITALDAENAL